MGGSTAELLYMLLLTNPASTILYRIILRMYYLLPESFWKGVLAFEQFVGTNREGLGELTQGGGVRRLNLPTMREETARRMDEVLGEM